MDTNVRNQLTADIKTMVAGSALSVSSLAEGLKDRGWKRLGTLSEVEDLVVELGFKLREEEGKGHRRCYVSL